VYQILSESTVFCGRHDKNILVCFLVHNVECPTIPKHPSPHNCQNLWISHHFNRNKGSGPLNIREPPALLHKIRYASTWKQRTSKITYYSNVQQMWYVNGIITSNEDSPQMRLNMRVHFSGKITQWNGIYNSPEWYQTDSTLQNFHFPNNYTSTYHKHKKTTESSTLVCLPAYSGDRASDSCSVLDYVCVINFRLIIIIIIIIFRVT